MKNIDIFIENRALKSVDLFSRIALFTVFFWFGFLKIVGSSPAENLVHKLFDITLSHIMPIELFLPIFGLFECVIGVAWLFPRLTKFAFVITLGHMVCTFVPLIVLTSETWQSFLALTLTGQYIIKNLVLLTLTWYVHTIQSFKSTVKAQKQLA